MTFLDIPDFTCECMGDKVRFQIGDISTNWISKDDSFTKRVDKSNLNKAFLKEHMLKEIEIKNMLDEGITLLKAEKYQKAILKFDDVLFYDEMYGEALLNKSFSLFGQKHFVKSLRHYKKAIKADASLKDVEYHKLLLKKANEERDNFPKLKQNIYVGDEFFAKGEFLKALDSYNRALANPSKFKDKIFSKLLNKKGKTLVKLNEYDEALRCFEESSDNDYACFGRGYCEYKLGLKISPDFKGILHIDKKDMLTQALILNELNYFDESLVICDYLMENHFKVDEFYLKILDAKKFVLKSLGNDLTDINLIFDLII